MFSRIIGGIVSLVASVTWNERADPPRLPALAYLSRLVVHAKLGRHVRCTTQIAHPMHS
jgi:hypothetical protein